MIQAHGKAVSVQKPTRTTSDMGGIADAFETTDQEPVGWPQPASANTIDLYRRREIEVTHTVYFASDPELASGDRLLVAGRVLAVQGVRNEAEMSRLWCADAREILT